MAKFVLELGDWAPRLAKQYNLASKDVIPIMKAALYEGAGIMADAFRAASKPYGLDAGVGIAEFEVSADGAQTAVGFRKKGEDGYFINRWGQKTPYDLVVNVLNKGTSRVPGTHFFDHARDQAQPKAQAAMHDKYYEDIMKIIGE
jgi:hypothetical protein